MTRGTDVEAGFLLDGATYEVPALDTFDMGERRVLYDYSGLVQEDFAPLEDESEEERDERFQGLIRHPGFMQALMHIAYARANPGLRRDKVEKVIERTNYLEAVASLAGDEAGDDGPPVLTPDSPKSSEGSSASSGNGSTEGSDEPAVTPEPTGRTR